MSLLFRCGADDIPHGEHTVRDGEAYVETRKGHAVDPVGVGLVGGAYVYNCQQQGKKKKQAEACFKWWAFRDSNPGPTGYEPPWIIKPGMTLWKMSPS